MLNYLQYKSTSYVHVYTTVAKKGKILVEHPETGS